MKRSETGKKISHFQDKHLQHVVGYTIIILLMLFVIFNLIVRNRLH